MYLTLPTMQQKSKWANCGGTCDAIISFINECKDRLGLDLKIEARLVEKIEFKKKEFGILNENGKPIPTKLVQYNAFDPELIRYKLNRHVESRDYTLLDICENSIHEFMIDVTKDGKSCLVNGYQFQFSALWWCGVSRWEESKNQDIINYARKYGHGKLIDVSELTRIYNRICDLLRCTDWTGDNGNETALAIWQQLPFVSMDKELLNLLYFPRFTPLSCGQAEQPLGDGLNFLLGDPGVQNPANFLRQQFPTPGPTLVGVARTTVRIVPG